MSKHFRLGTLAALLLVCLGTAFTEAGGRTIEVHAHRYAFTPSEITVKKGETVKLKLFSDDVTHSLLIKDLGINQIITKGKPSEVTLTPQKTGNFHGQCGRFCGSGHGKMAIDVHVTGN
ncbi:MAG TPA: cupredoxin domain-containing protein [Terracidiphilus sp.]